VGQGDPLTGTDDSTIPDDEDLWRRIPPWHFVFDENRGAVRPSSAAFDDDEDGQPMSVYLASAAAAPDIVLRGHAGFALATITAGLARECQQALVRDPLPEAPSHAVVIGRKTHGIRRRFAREAQWVISPPVTTS
jgi:hypothetical protein